MIRRKLLLAAGAGLAGLPTGCGSKEPSAQAKRDDPPAEDLVQTSAPASSSELASARPEKSGPKEWLVGAYLPLSGGDSQFGHDARRGIDLALDEINAGGGVRDAPIKVLFEDDKSTPNEVANKVQQLIDRDRVVALIGEIASSRSEPAAIIATKKGVPMISPAATNASVTKDKSFAFRVCFIDELQGRTGAEFAVKVLKKKNIALLFAEDDVYSHGLASEFKKAAEALGARIVAEKKVSGSEQNFSAHVKDLKAARPEIVYAPIYYQQMIALGREARAQALPGEMFLGGDGWSGEQKLLDELEGAYYTDHWVIDLPWPRSRTFVEAYSKRFKQPPSSVAATSYDALLVLAAAMKRARSMHGKDLRDAIAETRDFSGVTGPITIDAERNADKPVIIVQIRGKAPHFESAVGRGSEAILSAAKAL